MNPSRNTRQHKPLRQLRWLLAATVLFVTLGLVEGWSALQELNAGSEWRTQDAPIEGAALESVQVEVETQVAAISERKPERAILLIRLRLASKPSANQKWKDCRVSLHGPAGQTWMPLANGGVDGVIKALSPDRLNHGPCRLYLNEGDATIQADQIFMLPSVALTDDSKIRSEPLRLHISGLGTRPKALAFVVKPEIRRLP